MATTRRPEDSIRTTTTVAFTLAAEETLIVDRGIVISSATSTGVEALGDNVLTVNGTISGETAVSVQDAKVKVGAFGVVSGDTGLYSNTELNIENRGIISGDYQALAVYGKATITNHGTIEGANVAGGLYSAIYLGSSHTNSTITNDGTIKAKADDGYAIMSTSGADDRIINSGLIKGNVDLGYGDSSFNNAKGKVIGTIAGGAGEDKLTGGKYADYLIGGSDKDRLTGGKGSDQFEFQLGSGVDTITDFDAMGGGKKQDYLILPSGTDYVEKSAHHGRDTILDFGGGNTLTLLDVKKAEFSNADIHFMV